MCSCSIVIFLLFLLGISSPCLCDSTFHCVCVCVCVAYPVLMPSPSVLLKTQLRLWTNESLNKALLFQPRWNTPFSFSCCYSFTQLQHTPVALLIHIPQQHVLTADDGLHLRALLCLEISAPSLCRFLTLPLVSLCCWTYFLCWKTLTSAHERLFHAWTLHCCAFTLSSLIHCHVRSIHDKVYCKVNSESHCWPYPLCEYDKHKARPHSLSCAQVSTAPLCWTIAAESAA